MIVNEGEIAKYLRQAKKGCPAPYRRKLIVELQNNLYEFLENNPEHTMEDVLEHFGSPERFADEYLLAMDNYDRINAFRKTKWIRKMLCIGVATIVLIVAIATVWIVCENSQTVGYFYFEEVHETNLTTTG